MTTYNMGTISVGSGSTIVTGVGTAWTTSGIRAGDDFRAAGLTTVIVSVNSPTQLTITPWPGGTLSGANYSVRQIDDYSRGLTAANLLLQALGAGNLTSLGNLTGAADKLAYFNGPGSMVLTDLSAWGRSLIDDANVAAFWATIGASAGPAQAFRRGNVLGTVSQSGGVPTGALIERGSNANGEYWRDASGWQICTHNMSPSGSEATVWTFPAAFAFGPIPQINASGNASIVGTISAINATSLSFSIWTSANARSTQFTRLLALGRWF